MNEKHTHGADAWRAPKEAEGETLIFSEHGRDIHTPGDNYGVCYCSHWCKLVQESGLGRLVLLVKHGGGEERIRLWYPRKAGAFIKALAAMDSDDRYLMLHNLHQMHQETQSITRAEVSTEWRTAFVQGRIKRRKVRGSNSVKVWIESGPLPACIPQAVRIG